MRIDATTTSSSRGRYARICIQVDLDRPSVPKIRIGKYIQHIMYETITGLCFHCGCIGHNEKQCPLKVNIAIDSSFLNASGPPVKVEMEASQ